MLKWNEKGLKTRKQVRTTCPHLNNLNQQHWIFVFHYLAQYIAWVNRRWWAAVQLQRMVRGKQARKRVQQKLQVVFDAGIAGIDQEVAELEVIITLQ